jgi:hypothetical protein
VTKTAPKRTEPRKLALAGRAAYLMYDSPGQALAFQLYALRGITTGDTLDLSSIFSKIQWAAFYPITGGTPNLPTISAGSTVTFAAVGLANDSGVLLVAGGRSGT